jgi:hypothetical protein
MKESSAGDPFSELQVTNQCALVCDLERWRHVDSPAWQSLQGSQEGVGAKLAELFTEKGVARLDDFGGVCESFLCAGETYLQEPPLVKGRAAVFSFTPKKRLFAEGSEMARVCAAAGYSLLVLTLQKHDKFGKVWVLSSALRHFMGSPLTYYDDTGAVIDELKALPEGERVIAVHVRVPGYEQFVSRLADRVVSQPEYRSEVLA